MRRALILNAVNPRIGGVLIRGERGTAKSTAARALAALLPEVRVVADCRFGCDPDQPTTWCTECRERAAAGKALPTALRRTSFVDLPVSATEDRVVGTLDIERAIKEGERHFEAGVLAAANRGLLYIVEREGISFTHPARYILVGTMNPEEGDLRPQLLDRFALSVDIRGLRDPASRVAIMERNLAYEANPQAFRQQWMEQELALSRQIETARQLVESVLYTRRDLLSIAALTSSMQVDGHRSDLVILKAAKAHAALDGRQTIQDLDIALAAELALPHRLRKGPFQQSEISLAELQERIEDIQSEVGAAEQVQPEDAEQEEDAPKKVGAKA